jgi:prepilin-type processing-associated H-X9-DG protein
VQVNSNQVLCQHNLRQIGEALSLYQDRHEAFPAGTWPNARLIPEKRLSWYVALLPLLPENVGGRASKSKTLAPVFAEIDTDAAWDAAANAPAVRTPIPWFVCPANPHRVPPDSPRLTNYVGIAGLGPNAAELPDTDRNAGVFGYDRQTSRDAVQEGRGASETMMVAETALDNGPWAAGGPATVRGLDPGRQPYIGRGCQFGGLHPGGLNVLFVDGSVRFVREGISPEVFAAHATITRGKAVDGNLP